MKKADIEVIAACIAGMGVWLYALLGAWFL